MIKYLALFITISLVLSSCEKEEIKIEDPKKDKLEFIGTWSRVYDILGSDFTAKYEIDSNTINYSNNGDGPGNTEYTLNLDSYDEEDKRWIGHTSENKYYLLFFKNITETNITIYKQSVSDPNEAQNIKVPADDIEENYGWNTYKIE